MYTLFQTNQPLFNKPRKRSGSLIENIGLEVLATGPNANITGKRPTVRRRTEFKKTEYKNPIEHDEILSAIQQIFTKHGNYKGKLSIKNFYQHINDNQILALKRKNIISALNLRLTSEVSFEEICRHIKSLNPEKKNQLYSEENKEDASVRSVNKDIEVLKSLFDSYDINKDSKLSLEELKKGLKDKFSLQTIEELFHEYDLDENGTLDFEEFVRLYSPDDFILPKNE